MGEDPDGFRREVELYRTLSLETGCTIVFTIAQNNVQPGLWREIFARADAANAEGARLVPMTINRPGGLLLSWDTFHPFSDRKSYVEVADRPLAERVALLRDPSRRARIVSEPIETPMFEHAHRIITSSLGSTYLPTTPSLAEPDPAASLAARQRKTNATADEVVYDALCDAAEAMGGSGFLHVYMGNYAEGSLDVVHEMISRPGTLVVTTTVPAEIFVDDAPRGRAPVSLELPPGSHRVRAESEQGVRQANARVRSGETTRTRLRIPASTPSNTGGASSGGTLPALPEEW